MRAARRHDPDPSYLNPYRHAKRAIARRNLVLDAMADTGDITPAQAEAAKQEPLKLAPGTVDGGEAPYFVDLVRDQLTRALGNDATTTPRACASIPRSIPSCST